MPRSRYRVRQESCPHFLTATVNHWLPLFTRPKTVNIALDSWRFLQREAGLVIYGYVILENHLHLIAKSENLSADIQRFKSFTAREIIAYLESGGSNRLLELLVLFKRSHKTDSRYQESEMMMRRKLDYIHRTRSAPASRLHHQTRSTSIKPSCPA